jgi:membrane protein implicated in regulation of membrane protease activity
MALAGFIAVLVILAILESTWLREYFFQGALLLFLFALIRFALLVRRFRARRRERLRFPPLSRDERRVARSKLVKDRN